MILLGYAIEIMTLYIWYKKVIEKEVGESGILCRSIKILIKYRKIIKENLLFRVSYSNTKQQNMVKIKKNINNVLIINAWILCIIIITPILLYVIVGGENVFYKGIIMLCVLGGVLVEQLNKLTQRYISVIETYFKQVLKPLEESSRYIAINDDEKIVIQWTKRKKIVLLTLVIITTLMCVLFFKIAKYIKLSSTIERILGITTFIILIIGGSKKEKIKKENAIGVMFNNLEYELIKEDVERICASLKIKNIIFEIEEVDTNNAYAEVNRNGICKVVMQRGFITNLYGMLKKNKSDNKVKIEIEEVKKIFLGTVAHELGHVYYKDRILIKKWMLLAMGGYWVVCFIGTFFLQLSIYSDFFIVLAGVIFLINWIFGGVMCDRRYWGQIAELKADRIAVVYLDDRGTAFKNYWMSEEKIQEEEKLTWETMEENLLYKYYKRNIEMEDHPCRKRRKKLIETRGDWRWWEYFEHALLIRKWRVCGCGWNGALKR